MTQSQITRIPQSANPDADLLLAIERHDALWSRCGGSGETIDAAALAELCDLERRVAVTPAFSSAGLEAKRRVIARAEFDDDDQIVKTILDLDRARVGECG